MDLFKTLIIDNPPVQGGGGGGGTWGSITGTLSNQTDLQSALDAKAPTTSGTSILYGNGTGGFSNATVGSGLSFSLGTIAASVTSVAGRTGAVTLTTSDVSGLGTVATLNAGVANGAATLDASGKLTSTQIPDITVSDYLGSVASEAAMLALTGQKGDWCTRSDLGTNWVITGTDPTLIGSWTQLSYPTAPVISVAGKTGAVTLNSSDVGLGNVTNNAQTQAAIVPNTVPTNGQLLIGNGTNYSVSTLSAGSGVTITNTAGGVTIAATGATSVETLVATVTNAEAVPITKGQVVYAFGATGNRMSVKLANNTADATSAKTVGVVSDASIGAGNTGQITLVGVVDGLNLGTFTDGDTLYLGATPGSVTNVKPYAPNHMVFVGIVERANNGNGELYVRIQNGYELDELHNVQITSTPSAGSVLIYDATNALWKAATLTAGTGITITNGNASSSIALTNSSITIAGNNTALGGSVTQDQITGLSSTGIVKRTAANTLTTATSGTDYAPATSGTSILYGDGSGGFSNVTIGSNLTFSAGTLSAAAGAVTSVAGKTGAVTLVAADVGLGTAANATFNTVSDSIGNVRTIVQNAQTSAYILVAADAGKHVSITTGGVTVNSGIFTVGQAITIYNNSASSQTIVQGGSVTLRLAGSATTGSRTLAGYGLCTILCVASNVFVVSGSGVT